MYWYFLTAGMEEKPHLTALTGLWPAGSPALQFLHLSCFELPWFLHLPD